jgi:hypothetical protein
MLATIKYDMVPSLQPRITLALIPGAIGPSAKLAVSAKLRNAQQATTITTEAVNMC